MASSRSNTYTNINYSVNYYDCPVLLSYGKIIKFKDQGTKR
ncbi:hypothetical protein FVB9532_00336 [Mesonia oceanica]|uniref:Uncharacterized protein n=1 Tax=Mesonia oceanica TaxID=2687242 RepID=A0AC61Y3R1_9FLAO|nr:hypothetical protein FVB9532_00336 [Mesonia oceanica]